MQRVQHLYATPLRQGKVLMFYNIEENSIQFSKNRSEPRYQEDDFGIYVNRKYSFKLAYDERVIDIKWYNFNNQFQATSQGGNASKGGRPQGVASSAIFQSLDFK